MAVLEAEVDGDAKRWPGAGDRGAWETPALLDDLARGCVQIGIAGGDGDLHPSRTTVRREVDLELDGAAAALESGALRIGRQWGERGLGECDRGPATCTPEFVGGVGGQGGAGDEGL